MGYFVKNRQHGIAPYGIRVPNSVTADQPSNAVIGTMRYNTDLDTMEFWDGGNFRAVARVGYVPLVVDDFTGNGVQTIFTMSGFIPSNNDPAQDDPDQILVFVGGILQLGTSSYTLAGAILTFSEAPPLDTPIAVVHNTGKIT